MKFLLLSSIHFDPSIALGSMIHLAVLCSLIAILGRVALKIMNRIEYKQDLLLFEITKGKSAK